MSIDSCSVRLASIYHRLVCRYQHKINVKKVELRFKVREGGMKIGKNSLQKYGNSLVHGSHFTCVAIDNRCWQFFLNETMSSNHFRRSLRLLRLHVQLIENFIPHTYICNIKRLNTSYVLMFEVVGSGCIVLENERRKV